MSSAIWKNDSLYPPLLHEIPDAPERLFHIGKKLNPSDKYFAIVGTRRPSVYGKQMAEELSREIVVRGFVVVSGLAYGIDAIAHESALNAGGRTIAVLGSGFDHITPTCNLALARRIQKTGSILTEYEACITPQKFTFPARNRIIAGMSIATLVIEAPERSGALITARLALEYNRDVFALPGNITNDASKGANLLIRDCKAFPVTCAADIFEQIKLANFSETENKSPTTPIFNLSKEENAIYSLIKTAPSTVDHIISESKIPASKVSTILSMLEIKGLVTVLGSYVFITR